MKKRGGLPGRPYKGEQPLSKLKAVRLSQAEVDAIATLEITFSDLVRQAIAQAVADKNAAA